MLQRMNKHQFIDTFRQNSGRQTYDYSYEALDALYGYLDDIDLPVEPSKRHSEYIFDIEEIRGDWAEYETLEEAAKDYGYETVDELERNTIIIPFKRVMQLTKGYLVHNH